MKDWKLADKNNIAGTYGRFDVLIDHGQGAFCYDQEGRSYLDFTSGIGVNSLGFCNEKWVSAVSAQAAKLQHTSNLYYTQPQIELAEKLCARTGMSKVFFANSGAEANECAIKTARKYGNSKSGNQKNTIITLKHSFHGRTMATITATGQDEFHDFFHPFAEGFDYCPAGDIAVLKQAMGDGSRVCAVMMEMIQGEGGVIVLDKAYVKEVADLCASKDVLLIIDEVQTGVGRTGFFFAYENYGIEPDLVTFAKGIGGGLPIGGCLFNEKTHEVLKKGDHGTTFGGNPVCCAGALAVLDVMTDDFLAEVRNKGEYIRSELAAMPSVYDVDGMGLMIGFRVQDQTPAEVVAKMLEKGVLMLTAHDKVRMLPPLVVSREEIDQCLSTLKSCI